MQVARESKQLRGSTVSGVKWNAFTLIEMLLILVLIAILAGSVTVSLSGRREGHVLRAATEDLASAVRYAASQARLTGCEQRVVFLRDRRAYRVESALPGSDQGFDVVKGLAGREKLLPSSIQIAAISQRGAAGDDDLECIRFGSDGGQFVGEIQVQSESGQSAVIEVLGSTGQVMVTWNDDQERKI